MSNILFDPVKTQAQISDSVLVAFSGGKDAIVALDLCVKFFKRVEAFFMYSVPNLEFQEKILNRYEEIYGIKIHRLPHPDVSVLYHEGIYTVRDESVPKVTINDTFNYARHLSGIEWIASGERTTDSIERNAKIKNSSSIDYKTKKFYPVAYWRKSEIYAYIKAKKLYIPRVNKDFGYSIDGLWGDALVWLKENYPQDYQKVERAFPLYGAQALRWEKYGK